MNILLVSSYLPYPLFSGGNIRLYNIIRELSKRHALTLICEKRKYQTDKDVKQVGQFCKRIITVPRKKQWTFTNIIKTGFSPYPFLMIGHTLPEMKNAISEQLRRDSFDLIHVETFYVMQNLPQVHLPVVLAEQNIEYMVYQRFAKQAHFFLKPLLNLDILKMKYWEEKFWRKVARLIAVSSEEKALMGRKDVAVVPNGVDLEKYQVSSIKYPAKGEARQGRQVSKREKTILFIGDFRWVQNKDAAMWMLKEIWPMIKLKVKSEKSKVNLKLWIVGKEIPESIRKLGGDDVFFDENAPEETSEIFAKADILLAPIRVGGGTSFKILEAMAAGVPVVTTKVGIEGIEAKDMKDVLIADNSERLVEQTLKILQDDSLYKILVKNARALIEEKYNWRKIIVSLEKAYQSVTKKT